MNAKSHVGSWPIVNLYRLTQKAKQRETNFESKSCI